MQYECDPEIDDSTSSFDEVIIEAPEESLPTTSYSKVTTNTPKAKRRKRDPESELLAKACETLNNVANSQMSSEDCLGQYIAQKLKSIEDVKKKNAAEEDILQTLIKYF